MSAVDAAPLFAALGDPTRLALLARLSDGGPQSIAGLAAGSRLTRQGVTKHLIVLANAGLVGRERVGRESRFAYRAGPVEAAQAYLDAMSARWDAALGRLRAMVED